MTTNNSPRFWTYFAWLFVIDILFTGIDTLFHANVEALEVYAYPIPAALRFISTTPLFWYAVGKFLATLLIGSILFYFVKKGMSTLYRTLILSIPVVLLMEGRYLISGDYSTQWHVLNTVMHFCVLTISTYAVFRQSRLFDN